MAATRQPTEHLVFLGHERIAFVGGRTDLETGERRAGYTEAMRAAAMTLVLERLGGRDEARKLVLPLELRVRESW